MKKKQKGVLFMKHRVEFNERAGYLSLGSEVFLLADV